MSSEESEGELGGFAGGRLLEKERSMAAEGSFGGQRGAGKGLVVREGGPRWL